MLPLKHYLLLTSYLLVGGGIAAFLCFFFYQSLQVGGWGPVAWGSLILLALFSGTMIAGTLLPNFNLYTKAFSHGAPQKKWIALTFDDGPHEPFTSQILDVLKEKNVPATFFILGQNAKKHPGVVKRMWQENHVIGNHTFSHTPFPLMKKNRIEKEFADWEQVMHEIGIEPAKLFRAPRGWKSPFLPTILNQKGYQLIGWTRGVWDTDQPGVQVLKERLFKNLKNGEIILLHDGKSGAENVDQSQTVAALPDLIDCLQQNGFHLVTVETMIAEGKSPRANHEND